MFKAKSSIAIFNVALLSAIYLPVVMSHGCIFAILPIVLHAILIIVEFIAIFADEPENGDKWLWGALSALLLAAVAKGLVFGNLYCNMA